MPAPVPERKRELRTLVFVALALALLFPYFEQTRNANEVPRLMQAMAVVEAGELAIDGPAVAGIEAGPDVARSHHDGRLYPNKPPGVSMLATAAYVITRMISDGDDPPTLRRFTFWARVLTGVVPTVLLCGFLLRRTSVFHGHAVAAAAVILFVLGTPMQAYAHLAYGHALTAALLAVGTGLVVRIVVDQCWTKRGAALAFVGGALAGAAVVVEYSAAFAALPLGIMLLWRARTPRPLGLAALATLGALAAVSGLALYHQRVYGSVWKTGYHHVTDPGFAEKHAQGLLGLAWPRWEAFHTHVLAADTGLVWWAPLFSLALYGLARLAIMARDPAVKIEARVHLGLWLVYLYVVSSLSFEGGWRVGPRYLVLVLPSLVLGWSEALVRIRKRPLSLAITVALGTYAIVINTLAANLWPHFDPTNVHQPVAEVLLPLWERNFVPYGTLEAIWSPVVVKSIMAGIVALALLGLARSMARGSVGVIAFAVGVAAGVALVPATRAWPQHPMGRRNLAYIERVWEPKPHAAAPPASIVLLPLETTDDGIVRDVRGRTPSSR